MNNTLNILLRLIQYVTDIVIIEMNKVSYSAFKQRKANIIIQATMKLFGRIKVLTYSYYGFPCRDCGSETRVHAIFEKVTDRTEIICTICDFKFNIVNPTPEPSADIFQF